MQLWELILPRRDNAGHSLKAAHRALEALLLDAYGDVTKSSCHGLWADPSGRVYNDHNVSYRFLGRDPKLAGIVVRLGQLFPDQEAFFLACVGEGEVIQARAGCRAATLDAKCDSTRAQNVA